MFQKILCMAGFACLMSVSLHAAQLNSEVGQSKDIVSVEKERPQLSEETKKIIAEYKKNPTKENEAALRQRVEISYDKVLARKRAKLEELKTEAKDDSLVKEMQTIIEEMIKDKENRINQTMNKFKDDRLKPSAREPKEGFVPVIGAKRNVSIAYAPVTNEEYAVFVKKTKHRAPVLWINGQIPEGKNNHPVTDVSYRDAAAYCAWLTALDGKHKYRLPTEEEWELAAGHMPKDADMNCGLNKGTTSVTEFTDTLAASGAIDMWGNVWEWTSTYKSTTRGLILMTVKGGSWATPRTKCRTEYRGEAREASFFDDTVGFRVVREN